jgi:hypothetical protein
VREGDMSLEDLLRYGNWSGPGWTAGVSTSEFNDNNVERIITDDDRNVPGIDRYDSFVAKAHDLNEYHALDQLRLGLQGLGLIENTKTAVPSGLPAYAEELEYGDGGAESERFVSLREYSDKLKANGASDQEIRSLVRALIDYYMLAVYSNLQFSIDFVMNTMKRFSFQMFGASIIFNNEAAEIERRCIDAEAEFGVHHLGSQALSDHLSDHFVSPAAAFFQPVNGNGYSAALTTAGLLSTSRSDLVKASSKMIFKKDRFGVRALRQKIKHAAPLGFGSTPALMGFLDDL